MTYARLERRTGRNRTGTDPRVGQDNEKYFHIANKVILPRQGKVGEDRAGQIPALCQAMLTLVKNHEHFQVSPSETLFWPHPCVHTHLRAACFSRARAYFNLRRQRTGAGFTSILAVAEKPLRGQSGVSSQGQGGFTSYKLQFLERTSLTQLRQKSRVLLLLLPLCLC